MIDVRILMSLATLAVGAYVLFRWRHQLGDIMSLTIAALTGLVAAAWWILIRRPTEADPEPPPQRATDALRRRLDDSLTRRTEKWNERVSELPAPPEPGPDTGPDNPSPDHLELIRSLGPVPDEHE